MTDFTVELPPTHPSECERVNVKPKTVLGFKYVGDEFGARNELKLGRKSTAKNIHSSSFAYICTVTFYS